MKEPTKPEQLTLTPGTKCWAWYLDHYGKNELYFCIIKSAGNNYAVCDLYFDEHFKKKYGTFNDVCIADLQAFQPGDIPPTGSENSAPKDCKCTGPWDCQCEDRMNRYYAGPTAEDMKLIKRRIETGEMWPDGKPVSGSVPEKSDSFTPEEREQIRIFNEIGGAATGYDSFAFYERHVRNLMSKYEIKIKGNQQQHGKQ